MLLMQNATALPDCSSDVDEFNYEHYAPNDPHFITLSGTGPSLPHACNRHEDQNSIFSSLKSSMRTTCQTFVSSNREDGDTVFPCLTSEFCLRLACSVFEIDRFSNLSHQFTICVVAVGQASNFSRITAAHQLTTQTQVSFTLN